MFVLSEAFRFHHNLISINVTQAVIIASSLGIVQATVTDMQRKERNAALISGPVWLSKNPTTEFPQVQPWNAQALVRSGGTERRVCGR